MSNYKNENEREDLGFLHEMIDSARSEVPGVGDFEKARRNVMQAIENKSKEKIIMKSILNPTYARLGRATAIGLALISIVAVAAIIIFSSNPTSAYAAVVKQLRNATTVSFSLTWDLKDGYPTEMEMAYREPGLQRMTMIQNDALLIQIYDTQNNTGIILFPESNGFLNLDITNMPSTEQERIGLTNMLCEEMKTLPENVDEILDQQIINDRTAKGFRSSDKTVWIDTKTNELVAIDKDLGGSRMFMTNFQLNPTNLDENSFSTAPPDKFVPISTHAVSYDTANAGERDIIEYLKSVAEMKKDHTFPATTNPMEILTLEKAGLLIEDDTLSPEEEQQQVATFTQTCQNAVMFVMKMRSHNDWNYAGSGVSLGDAETPIAWWKPNDSLTYRVIWGDLSVSNLAEEDLLKSK